jgi:organic radical activating enzyme
VQDITITGWEPLIQQKMIEDFCLLLDDARHIQIETNGTIMPSKFILDRCKFNCSPKLSMSWNEARLAYNTKVLTTLADKDDTCFKFVFKNKDDIDEVLKQYDFLSRCQIWFMPEWVTKEENAIVFEETIDYILSTGCNVAIRGQNIMRDGAKRWV